MAQRTHDKVDEIRLKWARRLREERQQVRSDRLVDRQGDDDYAYRLAAAAVQDAKVGF